MDDYPGNSYNKIAKTAKAPKEETPEKPKVEKVVQGEVVRRKKPLRKRIAQTFGGEDLKDVWQYVLMDVLLPAAKDMIVDAGSQGLERAIFGEVSGRSRVSGRRSPGYTPYNKMTGIGGRSNRDEPRALSRRARTTHDFDEIVLATRPEAEDVLERLYDLISKYEVVTVADLYASVGIETTFVDDKWGWTDLRGAGAIHIKGGYLLDLPRPEPLD